jgi:DNA-binding XRE family transcriptional regulator
MLKSQSNLGKRVKAFRGQRQMSQPKAAIFFGVSMATICRIEAGKGCGYLTQFKIEQILDQQSRE